ncbi:MAG: hypothetical protein KDB62_00975 [Solirubrobacterales bacterium]|nr:hypothetical protein [Solirubrobacterales bacterium]
MSLRINRHKEEAMYVVIRSYSGDGAAEVFDLIEQKQDEAEEVIAQVPGFVGYVAFRTEDGGTAATICRDKAGAEESSRVAARWVLENVSQTPEVPKVMQGETISAFVGEWSTD